MYTCGNRNRPILCDCVTEFDYPYPTIKSGSNATMNQFEEICGIE